MSKVTVRHQKNDSIRDGVLLENRGYGICMVCNEGRTLVGISKPQHIWTGLSADILAEWVNEGVVQGTSWDVVPVGTKVTITQ